MTQTQQPQPVSQPATALVTTSLEEMTQRLELVLADKSASLDDVANSLGILHDSTNNPQARALCDATWAAVQVLHGATDQALDIATKALAAANTATQTAESLRDKHNTLVQDIQTTNFSNPLVGRLYSEAQDEVYEYMSCGDGDALYLDEPGYVAVNGGNLNDSVHPDTAERFIYTLIGQYSGFDLSDEMRNELSDFINDFCNRAEIEERAKRGG